MFGILRPCANRLGEQLRADWLAQLCGMCLALRDEHGHLARLVTNVDAVVVSALVEAQTGADKQRRRAGPCALRGMRPASVSRSEGARLAAAVSLLLASGGLTDQLADGDLDGPVRRRAARGLAQRWAVQGAASADRLGLDAATLLATPARQALVEAPGHLLVEITGPTEHATGIAFGQTAVVAGRPGNVTALTELGRLFGRLVHLIDAVEDLRSDAAAGRWNPITATGAGPIQVRALCDDALLGIRLALADTVLDDARLVHALLVHELRAALDRAFATAGASDPSPTVPGPPASPSAPDWPAPPTGGEPDRPVQRRNPLLGCLGWVVACGTCQACCSSGFEDPCTGQRREGACRGDRCGDCACEACDCDCCDCCDGCDACDCSC